ncbi:TonB family protein [Shewanella marinintestina]|uniref:energy transducer TonB n=1 Tax=Shewanella marinintestina TaxID=190305 RepID=UPI00200EA482|nr:energy transducer TonB [Shewanella marinintestina]MCL1146389.1 TonB family protein [Shewanella marinintestina]
MTPKRYFAFGCLTVLIQGGVLASQNSQPELQLSSGSAMGSNQAVSLSIAMQASQAPKVIEPEISPAETQIEPKLQPKKIAKAKTEAKTKPTTKPKPKAKPKPKVEPTVKPTKQVAKLEPKKPAPHKAKSTAEAKQSALEPKLEPQTAHNQAQVDAKQGVSKQAVALSQPTFASPPAQPSYPKKARKKGFQGTATIEVMFNQLGEQLSLTLVDSSGYRLLDKAALSAVEKWQFAAPKPQTAYAYTVRVPVKFALN